MLLCNVTWPLAPSRGGVYFSAPLNLGELLGPLEYGGSDTRSDMGIAFQCQLRLPQNPCSWEPPSQIWLPCCEKLKAHGEATGRCTRRHPQLCSQPTASITRLLYE